MKTTRLYTLVALLVMAGSGTSFGQSAEQIFIGTEPGEIIIQKQWYEYTFWDINIIFVDSPIMVPMLTLSPLTTT